LNVEYWWSDTDRGKQNMEYWRNDTDRGKQNAEYWWNDSDRGKQNIDCWWNDSLTDNFLLQNRDQPFNVFHGNNCSLLWQLY
jgi:hypothetical protein